MNISKPLHIDGDVAVRVWNAFGGSEDIVIRKMDRVLQLEGKDYHKYQIVQPQGYEKEEIFHRPDKGREALLSVVFMTLAEAERRRKIQNG